MQVAVFASELKELERVNERQTVHGPVCSENETIDDVLECEYISAAVRGT